MTTFHLIISFLLFQTNPAFALGLGLNLGLGIGGETPGGDGVWIGNRPATNPNPQPQPQPQPQPPPPTPSSTNLNNAYIALQAWKLAIIDDPNGILTNWVGPNVCNYKGIFCTNIQNTYDYNDYNTPPIYTITSIDLNHANLKGTLVKEISFLTDLSILHLNTNKFSGIIPDTFNALKFLTELDLSNNVFSGPFPINTLTIPNLLYLDLRFNNFSGKLPDELFNKNLDAILLNDNQFSSQLPQNIGNSPASVINLANNMLSGEIPASLSNVNSRLKEILFLNNKLTGCIPDGIGLFSDMQVFDVSYNNLVGQIPDALSCLEDIQVLNFAHNALSGELSDLVCSLKNLVNLNVQYNFFDGLSQKCSGLLLRSVGFDFSANCIPGKGMQRPEPDCSEVPEIGGKCRRIDSSKPLVCGSLLDLVLHLGPIQVHP